RRALSPLQVLSFGHPHVPALRHLAVPLPTRLWRRVHSNLVTPARSVMMHMPIVLCTGFIRCGSREQGNRNGDLERPSRGRMILLSVGMTACRPFASWPHGEDAQRDRREATHGDRQRV